MHIKYLQMLLLYYVDVHVYIHLHMQKICLFQDVIPTMCSRQHDIIPRSFHYQSLINWQHSLQSQLSSSLESLLPLGLVLPLYLFFLLTPLSSLARFMLLVLVSLLALLFHQVSLGSQPHLNPSTPLSQLVSLLGLLVLNLHSLLDIVTLSSLLIAHSHLATISRDIISSLLTPRSRIAFVSLYPNSLFECQHTYLINQIQRGLSFPHSIPLVSFV